MTATEAEVAEQKRYGDMLAETEAMRRAFDAMRKLDDPAKRRVMRWLDAAIWKVEEPPF